MQQVMSMSYIEIKKARANNLKGIDVRLPHGKISIITGISGSGKSSLAFETVFREGSRRYLSSVSSYARHYLSKFGRGEAESITGLSPAVSVNQKTGIANSRSTVGTMTEISDHLRLLFSRAGSGGEHLSASSFSFNSEVGACSNCRGLGVEECIDPDLFVARPEKSLRSGALGLTTPSGYIIYSQVTMDVLDSVCAAHGFSVDTPWKDLAPQERDIVFYGSGKIRVPFGKHPLESRLKWKGITARPREEGYYKGIVPVMEEILKRDRNKNILRFVSSRICETCGGARLKSEALGVTFGGKNIAEIQGLPLRKLMPFLRHVALNPGAAEIVSPIIENVDEKVRVLEKLELGYLSLDRESTTLSNGETKRIRLANQVIGGLGGVVYVLDEPTVGLHPRDTERLLDVCEQLRDLGNTLVIVEHDEAAMARADWLVDVGPLAGSGGGELLFQGTPSELISAQELKRSQTWRFLTGRSQMPLPEVRRSGRGEITVKGACEFNLQHVDASFRKGALNVVTGVSGSGKSTLVIETLGLALAAKLHGSREKPGKHEAILGAEGIERVIRVDQKPIGRTPRSNPATYTDLFDMIRDIYASQETAVARRWKKGRFSFNVKGGRCEACEGAAVQRIGMHFMEDVEIPCEECGGSRFKKSTLEVEYKGMNIAQVLNLSVDEAAQFFADIPKIFSCLATLQDVGLGYLRLGQPSNTLSGGEAERIKLAAELHKTTAGHTLYLLDEPTTGLHFADVKRFLKVINRIVDSGNTVVVIEHNLDLVRAADWVVDLGPGGGEQGGRIVAAGTPENVAECVDSPMGQSLRQGSSGRDRDRLVSAGQSSSKGRGMRCREIRLSGITTHNLCSLDLNLPHGKTTVITGVSGSGKSSLAIDTLYAEARRRFSESLSTQARRYLKQLPRPPILEVKGLTPAIAIGEEPPRDNPRSTVGTMTEIYHNLRLLYSRVGRSDTPGFFSSQMFSFNSHLGACKTCDGLGLVAHCLPEKLVSDPQKSLFNGAMDGHKTGRFYGERWGRHLAILAAVGRDLEVDFEKPWCELTKKEKQIAMYGAPDREFEVCWRYRRKGREGEHRFTTKWLGFARYVEEEYERVHKDKRGEKMRALMGDEVCESCQGERLASPMREVKFAGLRLGELVLRSAVEAEALFRHLEDNWEDVGLTQSERIISADVRREITHRLQMMVAAGLGYLELYRPISTLSGGERRRLALIANLGVDLSKITYILDEPTAGLHRRDIDKILGLIARIRANDNTVIIVENQESVLRFADKIVELGPDSGRAGGRVVAEGSPAELEKTGTSRAARILAGKMGVWSQRKKRELGRRVEVRGAKRHNLRQIDVAFPLGGMVAVTGVSGSGKTTLVFDVLIPSLKGGEPVGCGDLWGSEQLGEVIAMDQAPIGRSPASNPATYTGVFDKIRQLFARGDLARQWKLGPAKFSFNSKGGRCETCKGMGQHRVKMGFLADVWLPCETCGGARYKPEILQVTYRGKSIADVLKLSAEEAVDLFEGEIVLRNSLNVLVDVGLGYLPLGQSALTLSAGEAERLKLAKVLVENLGKKRSSLPRLYVFDEPTLGLHPTDVVPLLDVFNGIVEHGHTVLILEHSLELIAAADWVIDLGPEGGQAGGTVVAEGPPSAVADTGASHTGKLLRRYFELGG